MSITDIIVKILGVILAIVGFALLLSCVGLDFLGVAVAPIWLALVLGFVFLAVGIYIVKGGTFTI
jgi:lipopolysaccharide export LptBFGC system permease protein LptF